jgi:hypothetical protein
VHAIRSIKHWLSTKWSTYREPMNCLNTWKIIFIIVPYLCLCDPLLVWKKTVTPSPNNKTYRYTNISKNIFNLYFIPTAVVNSDPYAHQILSIKYLSFLN